MPKYAEAVELEGNNQIRIDLTKIDKAAAFVENCELRTFYVDSEALILGLDLK